LELAPVERPGLLLSDGVVYIGFGSNGCNDHNTGWVLAYEESTLKQVGSFNTSPDIGFTSIWQTGNGLSADEFGNIYAVTAEDASKNEANDVAYGGSSYSKQRDRANPNPNLANSLVLTQWFAPDDVLFLNGHDLDLSSGGPVFCPIRQSGAASGGGGGQDGRFTCSIATTWGCSTAKTASCRRCPRGRAGRNWMVKPTSSMARLGSCQLSRLLEWNALLRGRRG